MFFLVSSHTAGHPPVIYWVQASLVQSGPLEGEFTSGNLRLPLKGASAPCPSGGARGRPCAFCHCRGWKGLAAGPATACCKFSVHCGCGTHHGHSCGLFARSPTGKWVHATPMRLYVWEVQQFAPMQRGGCKTTETLKRYTVYIYSYKASRDRDKREKPWKNKNKSSLTFQEEEDRRIEVIFLKRP